MKLILIFLYVFNVVLGDDSRATVTIPLGKIEGTIKNTLNGRPYYSFSGIPYARPPVGEYRFKEPEPVEPWTGVWQAKTIYKCMQYSHLVPVGADDVFGDEDCLYVNVFTPTLDSKKKLDVLVFIHGGAFMFLWGNYYGPQIILDRDVIYVTLNYRLGPLGFLSTEDDVLPGNNGLKDQILALRWIKDNIEYFGGNPDSITVSGMSAGGASVQFHYLTPKSRGLFHRGISQSGSMLNPWTLVEKPLEKAIKLATVLGCPSSDTKKLVNCLKRKPARQITEAVEHFHEWQYNPFTQFGPVVDTWASDPVFPDHPYNLLKKGQVQDLPWIISYTSSEGLYPAADFSETSELAYINDNWNAVIPYILHYHDVVEPEALNDISEQIRQHYFKGADVSKETFPTLVELFSDRIFVHGIDKASRLHSAAVKSPVYSYYFNYRGVHSLTEILTGSDENFGVSHADDTNYMLYSKVDVYSTEDDRQMSKFMVDLVTSFMSTGAPNVSDWRTVSKTTTNPWIQLRIDSPYNVYVEEKMEIGNKKFWDSLPFREDEKLFKTKDEL